VIADRLCSGRFIPLCTWSVVAHCH